MRRAIAPRWGVRHRQKGLQMELSEPGGAPTVCLEAVARGTHCALIDPGHWRHSVAVLLIDLPHLPAGTGGPVSADPVSYPLMRQRVD